MKADFVDTHGVRTDQASSYAPNLSRLIRLPEVMNRVGLSRSAIYKRMSEGTFPKSRSLGPKCAVWVESEINDWICRTADTRLQL